MTTTRSLSRFAVAAVLLCSASAAADDAGIGAVKLVVVDKIASAGKAKVVFVARNDAGLHKGVAGSPSVLSGSFEALFLDDPANAGAWLLPPGGWVENDAQEARYVNRTAPVGGGVKVALIKDGKLAKVVTRSLGDAPTLDVSGPPGAAGVLAVLTLDNAADATTHRLCTRFPNDQGQIRHVPIAEGTGRRLVARDGVPTACPERAGGTVLAGGSVGTDVEADGTTPDDPVETTVTSPVAGIVSILEVPATGGAPAGFELLGQGVELTAPQASATTPLALAFLVDASVIRAGADAAAIQVFRDGVLVEPCIGAAGEAFPDPCVAERTQLGGGDVLIGVLTSHASSWRFGLSLCGNGALDAGEACEPPGVQAQCTAGETCKSSCQCSAPCDCCAAAPTRFEFRNGIGSGACGSAIDLDGLVFKSLDCNGLYFGGGSSTVPPGRFAEATRLLMNVTACDPSRERLTLGPRTSLETGSARTCSAPGCLFGPPMPIANPVSVPTSICLFPSVSQAATGTTTCEGDTQVSLPLTATAFLTGDLLSAVPGIQPCPLCVGSPGTCQGGPNNGMFCQPGTSQPGVAFPTSHDCPVSSLLLIGSLPLGATLTTGTVSGTATPSGTKQRVFCGFCRDANASGRFGVCTAGPSVGALCGVTGDCGAGGSCESTPCESDLDCDVGDDDDGREACEQRNEGAFGPNGGGVQTITLAGSPTTCLADGALHATTLAGATCIPPTFNGILDAAGDLPAPAALSLQGQVTLATSTCTCGAFTPTALRFTTAVTGGVCGSALSTNGTIVRNLDCGGLYVGGGSPTVAVPAVTPDLGVSVAVVPSCVGSALTLASTTTSDTGTLRTCTAAGCLFGAPVPRPNFTSPATSTCLVSTIAADLAGSADCTTGSVSLNLPINGQLFLGGDVAPGEPGIQPCPVCVGGSCLGGPNNGMSCTPGTSDLGDAHPTSHDCPPNLLTFVGTLSLPYALTTGTVSRTAAPSSTQAQVFCGFCRDLDGGGGFGVCSGGPTPGAACVVSGDCGGSCGTPLPCSSDADCAGDPREACVQRNEGAFGPNGAAVQTITVIGAPGGDLGDGANHALTLASAFCIPPTFNAILDTSEDLPGPGAITLPGIVRLE